MSLALGKRGHVADELGGSVSDSTACEVRPEDPRTLVLDDQPVEDGVCASAGDGVLGMAHRLNAHSLAEVVKKLVYGLSEVRLSRLGWHQSGQEGIQLLRVLINNRC